MFNSVKRELGDLVEHLGHRLIAGMAKSLAENMPLYRLPKAVEVATKAQNSLLSMIPSRNTVLDMILGQNFRSSKVGSSALEILDEDQPTLQVSEEIKAIEEELQKLHTESHFAHDIQLYERCLWQSITLRRRIWLYVFHMGNFFWNGFEAEKARVNDGIVKVILWAAGAVFSTIELRKSASFRNLHTFYCYTPERFGLTVMKISILSLFLFQCTFMTSFSDLNYSQSLDKLLEKAVFSVIGSTLISVLLLTLLNRGYTLRIQEKKLALADHEARLHELLAQRKALFKKD
jgi:hypothetical protein